MKHLLLLVALGLLVVAGSPPVQATPAPVAERAAPDPCDRLLAFHANAGDRTVHVFFTLGRKPVVQWSGPTPGERLAGRFTDQAGPYHWWVVWDPAAPAPVWSWGPGPADAP